jgi:hypothetical protein
MLSVGLYGSCSYFLCNLTRSPFHLFQISAENDIIELNKSDESIGETGENSKEGARKHTKSGSSVMIVVLSDQF